MRGRDHDGGTCEEDSVKSWVRIAVYVVGSAVVALAVTVLLSLVGLLGEGRGEIYFLTFLVILLACLAGRWWGRDQGISLRGGRPRSRDEASPPRDNS